MASLKTFEDLDCCKKASQLRKDLSETVTKFPSEEKYRLVVEGPMVEYQLTDND